MSYRELRDFTEYMRVLGYPRLVSLDNFRTPNFALVADILYWMVHRYDPVVSLSDDISTEDDRVEFLISVAEVMWTRAHVKLNTKRLYSADGKAVKELLKVAKLLYTAHKSNFNHNKGNEEGKNSAGDDLESFRAMQARLPNAKVTRKLASQITESGAKIFDLLQDERKIAADRQASLRFLETVSNNLASTSEHKFIGSKLDTLLANAKDNVQLLEKQCQDAASDEQTLQMKIKKKQGELERSEKRLKSLQSVRPAFMDEYEKLEEELQRYYEIYVEKVRNLDFLEKRLEAYNRREREKLEDSERARKQIQMQAVERRERDIRGDGDDYIYKDDPENTNPSRSQPARTNFGNTLSSTGGPTRNGATGRRVLDDNDSEFSEEMSGSDDDNGGSFRSDSEDLDDDDDGMGHDDGSDISGSSDDHRMGKDSDSEISGSDDNF